MDVVYLEDIAGDGRIHFASPAALTRLGYQSESEVVSKDISRLFRHETVAYGRIPELPFQATEPSSPARCENSRALYRRPDGNNIHMKYLGTTGSTSTSGESS